MNHTITTEQINQVLSYLAAKPFQEVHGLIALLKQMPVQEGAVESATKPTLVPSKAKEAARRVKQAEAALVKEEPKA